MEINMSLIQQMSVYLGLTFCLEKSLSSVICVCELAVKSLQVNSSSVVMKPSPSNFLAFVVEKRHCHCQIGRTE